MLHARHHNITSQLCVFVPRPFLFLCLVAAPNSGFSLVHVRAMRNGGILFTFFRIGVQSVIHSEHNLIMTVNTSRER